MTRLYRINHAALAAKIPQDTPHMLDIQGGLPPAKRIMSLMAGSSKHSIDTRRWMVEVFLSALARIEDLEEEARAPRDSQTDPTDQTSALTPADGKHALELLQDIHRLVAPQPANRPLLDALKEILASRSHAQMERDALHDELAAVQTALGAEVEKSELVPEMADAAINLIKTLRTENEDFRTKPEASFQSVHQDLVRDLGIKPHGSVVEAVDELRRRCKELTNAATRAQVYYTSWQALKRRMDDKVNAVPSDEMNLASAVTDLVEKGYITDITPGGQIPIETMCQMVASITTQLPKACDLQTPRLASDKEEGDSAITIYREGALTLAASILNVGMHRDTDINVATVFTRDIIPEILQVYADRSKQEAKHHEDIEVLKMMHDGILNVYRTGAEQTLQCLGVPLPEGSSHMQVAETLVAHTVKTQLDEQRHLQEVDYIFGCGDPIPAEVRVHDRTSGTTRAFMRADLMAPEAIPSESAAPSPVPAADVTGYQELEQINAKLSQQLQESTEELERIRPLAQDRRDEIFFRMQDGTAFGCDNMSIGSGNYVHDMSLKVISPDGTTHRVPMYSKGHLEELSAAASELRSRIEDLKGSNAQLGAANQKAAGEIQTLTRDRNLLIDSRDALQITMATATAILTGSEEDLCLPAADGLLPACRALRDDHNTLTSDLAHQMVQLDKFRAGVRAITPGDPGTDEDLLKALRALSMHSLIMPNGEALFLQGFSTSGAKDVDGFPVCYTDMEFLRANGERLSLENRLDAEPEPVKRTGEDNLLDEALRDVVSRVHACGDHKDADETETGAIDVIFKRGDNESRMRAKGYEHAIVTLPRETCISNSPDNDHGVFSLRPTPIVTEDAILVLVAWSCAAPPFEAVKKVLTLRPLIQL